MESFGIVEHCFTKEDVRLFADISGDDNPLHLNERSAVAYGFKGCIVHGLLGASLFPAIIGSQVPGAVYVSQTLKFHRPILVEEAIIAKIVVEEQMVRKRMIQCKTSVVLKNTNTLAISGTAQVLIPRKQ